MLRKVDEDTRFGVGSYRFTADNIHSLEEAMEWLCKVKRIGGYNVHSIRLEDIDGNENDTTTRMPVEATPEEICENIRGKEIGRVTLVGEYMGETCRVSVYLKGYTIQLFLNTLDPFIHDRIVSEFQGI